MHVPSFVLTHPFAASVTGSFVVLLFGYVLFLMLEPSVVRGQIERDQFEVSLTVTDEVTFSVPPANVTLSPSLSGITGGTADGATTVVVRTNNTSGYQMTLQASSSAGMIGNSQATSTIPAYTPATSSVPDFTFTTPANSARFGYTVEASSTPELAVTFRDNGTTCGVGGGDTAFACWLNASTSAVTIMLTSGATTGSGSTSTIRFRAQIQPNPSPSILEDTYTATSTLTLTNN